AMHAHSNQAAQLRPASLSVRYWQVRACLRSPNEQSPKGILQGAWPNSPRWLRLRIEADLHQRPSVENAQAMLPILEGKLGPLDPMELQLIVVMLHAPLTIAPGWE